MSKHSLSINGTEYVVHFTTDVPRKEYGSCSDPHGSNPVIQINSRKRGDDLLYAILHECRHASDWNSCEEEIIAYSSAVTSFISRPEILRKLKLQRRK